MEDLDKQAIYRFYAGFCKNLADANRLLIINALGKGEMSVGELTRCLGLNQSNVSKHLALMREYSLVTARRDGASIYYSLCDARISEAINLLKAVQMEQIEKQRRLAHREFMTSEK